MVSKCLVQLPTFKEESKSQRGQVTWKKLLKDAVQEGHKGLGPLAY